MAKTGFLNALTIIGYVFVGLFVFMATYLGIAYATGYFNPQKEPVVGLKFTDANDVIISENGGVYKLKIVSSNATIEVDENGNQIVTDTATPADVRLTVRNSAGLVDNSIISLPEIVKTGEEFEIKALIDETDGYDCNVGGDCYINAETVDGTYKALALAVFVDVPIKEIQIGAKNPLTNEQIDLNTANFIFDDRLQLVASVFPSRALNPYSSSLGKPNKTIEFTPDDASSTMIEDRYNGLVRITYNPSNAGDDLVIDPFLAKITATAKSVYDEKIAASVTKDCEVRLFPIQLEEILIQNKDYADSGKSVETLLFNEDNPIKFSVVDTGLRDVINLDVFLKPTIYNPDNNANPLGTQLNNFQITCETSLGNKLGPPIDVIRETVKVNNVDVPVWTIKALRTLEPNEEVNLIFGVVGHDAKSIKRIVEVNYNIPESFVFTNENGEAVVNNTIDMYITKNGENLTQDGIDVRELHYTYDNAVAPTFSKFVFFVDKNKKENETGSLIINVNETGQLVLRNNKDTLNARGAGTVNVIPYVVRTNANGQAVDCFYNVIEDGMASGVAFYDDRIPFTEADANKYVVYRQYSALTVNVKERLSNFTIYSDFSDGEFLNEINSTSPLIMGTQIFNAKRIYALPNSALALPETTSGYQEWKDEFGEILFNLQYTQGEGLVVPESGNTINLGFESIGDSPDNYQRYMWFDIYTVGDEEVIGSVNLYKNNTTLSNLIYINAQNVPIANIAVNREGTGIVDGFGAYSNLKYWGLDLNISTNSQTHKNKNYLRLNWTQQISGKSSPIVLPEPIVTASEEWQARGCKPSKTNYAVNFYAFDTSITYNLSDTDELLQGLSILDVLNYSTDTSTADGLLIHNKKWEIINSLLNDTDNDIYAKVENVRQDGITTIGVSTIQFIKALPTNYTLFMVYSVNDANSTALPDFVRVNYRYPTVHFFENSYVYGDEDLGTGYNLISSDSIVNNSFYYHNAVLTKALAYDGSKYSFNESAYDFKTEETAEGFNVIKTDENNNLYYGDESALVNDSSAKKYFSYSSANMLPGEEETSGNYFSISLNTEAYKIIETGEGSSDSTYSITISRTVNFVSDVLWTDELWESDLTSITNLDSYFNNTVSYSSTYTINFVVKNGYIDTINAS